MFISDETIIGVPFFPALMNPIVSKGVTRTFRGESEQVVEFWKSLLVPVERGGPRIFIVGLAEREEIPELILEEFEKDTLLHLVE
jgi:hypothetical protein